MAKAKAKAVPEVKPIVSLPLGAIKIALVTAGHMKKAAALDEAAAVDAIEKAELEIQTVAAVEVAPNLQYRLVVSGAASILSGQDIGNYTANLTALADVVPEEDIPALEAVPDPTAIEDNDE